MPLDGEVVRAPLAPWTKVWAASSLRAKREDLTLVHCRLGRSQP
jgi:hypothetical protein